MLSDRCLTLAFYGLLVITVIASLTEIVLV